MTLGATSASAASSVSTAAEQQSPAERIEGFHVPQSVRSGSLPTTSSGFTHSVVPFPRRRSIQAADEVAAPADRVAAEEKEPRHEPAGPELVVLPLSPHKFSSAKEGLLFRELSGNCTAASSPTSPNSKARASLKMATRAIPMHDSVPHEPRLLQACQAKYPVFKSSHVETAFELAARAHEGQRSFFMHAVGTACILADMGLDDTTVSAGLLHGVLDRTMVTAEDIADVLPEEGILEMVEKVSRLSEISQLHNAFDSEDSTLRKLRAMILSMADVRVVLVKIAERVQSLRTSVSVDVAARASLAREAMVVFAPLANRLGVWTLKAELEDLSFQILHPTEHAALKERAASSQQAATITAALDRMKGAMEENGIRTEDLSGRPKNLYSLFQKMKKKGYSMDEIYDVRAIRVIVNSKADCYAALRQVHNMWDPVPGRLKDYIRDKKGNGYQSLHTVVMGDDGVPFEVQIRTAKMHYIAEHGVAAHWRYKEASHGHASRKPLESDDDESVSPDVVTEAHVEFARYLITWELELQDKKCRPSGSPEVDNALASLHGEICRFPIHNENCPFHRLQMGRPKAPDTSNAPIYCVVVQHEPGSGRDSLSSGPVTELKELPPGMTTQQLIQDGYLGDPTLLVGKQILINHQAEDVPGATVLMMGDQVELVDAPSSAVTSPVHSLPWESTDPEEERWESLPDAAIDHQRKLFDDLFYRSSSGGMAAAAI